MRKIIVLLFIICRFLSADIYLNGNLHPGDNDDFNGYTPKEPLTFDGEHTYNYYLNNPTKFYLSEDSVITGLKLNNAVGIDGKIKVYIDGNEVGEAANDGDDTVAVNNLSLSKGWHDIAVISDCYDSLGDTVSCNSYWVDDIDDYMFSGITLYTSSTTTAFDFIGRHHIGDNNDNDDWYDIDDTSKSWYPDANEGQCVTYNLNINSPLNGYQIFISRVRNVYKDGIDKIDIYDAADNLIKTLDINTTGSYKFDFNQTVMQKTDSVSKIKICSGNATSTDLDDISFGETVFIPFYNYDLKAGWQLDECYWQGSYGEVTDSSGNGLNGTAVNGANTQSGGVLCKDGYFNGSDYVDMGDILNDVLGKTSNKFTITAWIKPEVLTTKETNHKTENVFLAKASDSYNDNLEIGVNTDGSIHLYLDTKNKDEYADIGSGIQTGQWYFVGVTYNDGNVSVYINNNKYTSDVWSGGGNIDNAAGSNFTIGASIHKDTFFTGNIDEVKVFGDALDDNQIKQIYDNEKDGYNYDGSERVCNVCPDALLDYRMDECRWDNDANTYEIKNYGIEGANYDATALNDANTTKGLLCRGGDINSTSTEDKAVMLENNYVLPASYTLNLWVKFPLNTAGHTNFTVGRGRWQKTYNYFNIADRVGSDYDYIYFAHNVTDDTWTLNVSDDDDTDTYNFNPQNLSGWHMLTFVVNNTGTDFYLDGDYKHSFSTHPNSGELGLLFNSDYKSSDNTPNGQSIGSDADEFTLLNAAVNSGYVKYIYNNESSSKNWDGRSRCCKFCCSPYSGEITPIEFEGGTVTLNNTYSDPEWTHVAFKKAFNTIPVVFMVIDTYGNNPASVRIKNVTTKGFDAIIVEPEGEDGPHVKQTLNYFAINTGVHELDGHLIEVGSINTKKVQGKYAPSGNDIGWDTVDTSVSFCNPAVVANIQTLNNEENDIPKQPSVPWMTAAVNLCSGKLQLALDMSETDEGNVTKDETIGYMISDANFTGSFTDDYGTKIDFEVLKTGPYFVGWDNGCKTVSFQNSYENTPLIAGWKDSRFESDGGWFRRCELTNKKIGFVVDEDEAHDEERYHMPEVGGIFAFSANFHLSEVNEVYRFDAWNDDHNITDRNITTKIVNKPFIITVASLDTNGTGYQEFNGTVCSRVIAQNYTGDWNKTLWNNENEKNITLKVNRALKNAKINIQWKQNEDTTCPINDANESNSTDNFAIRPEKFVIANIPSNIKAGNEFNITVKAVDVNGNPVKDYNESIYVNGQSVDFEYNESKTNCDTGILEKVSGGVFKDGEANITLKYNEVGDLNLTVKEINGSEFAVVDNDDTNETERFISQAKSTISVGVDHFDLNAKYENYDTDSNFTYYDEDLNISSLLELNISAVDKDGNILQNYNKECYAKNITVNISHNDVDVNVSKIIYKYIDKNGYVYDNNISKDENITFIYDKNNFTTDNNGSTSVDVYLNFDRNVSNPVNPFEFEITSIDVNDSDANGSLDLNKKAKYYYGNLLLSDVLASENDFNKSYSFIVFDSVGNLKPDGQEVIYNWYENTGHNAVDGNVSDSEIIISSDYNASNSINGVDVSVDSINNGVITFKISRSDSSVKFAVVHLLSPNLKWLWYSKFNQKYDISNDSTCLNHFCFTITWQNLNSEGEVGSGEFEGTEANMTDTNSTKRGIKIFR
ncbi:hypothetical protein NAMH_1384 [Nautilia profundicola AmH]|uniref:H-type lectin domain-containing protein n=1 Tax=Nautilia profundicola (strain ATCC BAA-1463 / DSM 18972 / AmH) TaxID=598659 RepID=B9L5Y9_NAUPA|nr:LamG-like jellyroll fold domain-containing protein [Nautilia profundicola]ACM93277.1 hypothetical protein NAMH_1384 [Nautilia profundicola AmH]